ncbi:Com family DNA-binding transcriptional regulator [Methylomonas sp. EFPC1]|nr:Com family DNA-binding transcriptional regulator [Methylomonas sp. EFPC1]
MEIVRCKSCNRKLLEAEYICLSIKCPRCGRLNFLKAIEPLTRTPGASQLESYNGKSNNSLGGR